LIRWEETFDSGPDGLWRTSADALLVVFGPVGAAVILGSLIALALWSASRTYWGSFGGLAVSRAAACRSLHALLKGKTSLSAALLLAAKVADHPWLTKGARRAAHLIESGEPLGRALGKARLVPRSLEPLWGLGEEPSVPDDEGEEQLCRVVDGLAGVLEAEARALIPVAGRWVWMAYALIGGSLTFWFALTLLSAWLEVNEWPT